MSNNYEMMYILRPDLPEEKVQELIEKYKQFLVDNGATGLEMQVRGKKRLAYPIQKFNDGVYVQLNYSGDGSQIAPLERAMRLSEEVIRYLTIKLQPVKVDKKAKKSEETETVAAEA